MGPSSTIHHRRSIRLQGHDYTSPGAYFVTIVAYGHKCVFGKIIEGQFALYDLGKIAYRCWQEIPQHFYATEVEPFIVMPNHIHGIITICDFDCRGTIYRAPTKGGFGEPVRASIPTIIRAYKAAVSRYAKSKLGWINVWQRNYYEHIIRDEHDMEMICDYILGNPGNWSLDPEYRP